ncbi:L-serine ammonia-lyase, iron-sulfur-dependent, subunit alpha [Methanocaldococcus sp.]
MEKNELITEILKKEIVKALGCTEVGLIGYTVAKAKPDDVYSIKEIKIILDKGTFKNAYSVGVPNTGKFGILPAVVGGLLGNKENGLEIFKDIKYDEELEEFIKDKLKIEVIDFEVYCKVYIEADKTYESETKGSHSGKVIDETLKEAYKKLTLKDFIDYLDDIPKDVINLIKETININNNLSIPEVPEDFINLNINDDILNNMVKKTVSGVYNRMIGIRKPAMAIAGSGNMGLVSTLPIIAYDEINDKDEEKLIKSITLSSLTTIYSTYYSSYISSMCGCVNRGGIGAVSGLSYYIHYNEENIINYIEESIKSFTANLTGIICDGGKIGCALKIASGVFGIYLSLFSKVPYNNGIVGKNFEECIKNIGKIGKSMKSVDDAIIEILKSKEL